MDGITAYALSKKIAASAVSGVQSMSVSGQTLTINTKNSGVLTMTFPVPKDGLSVTDIEETPLTAEAAIFLLNE